MSKWIKIGLPVIILIGIIWAYRVYHKERVAVNDLSTDYELNAGELAKAFTEGEDAANAKYLGKVLEVSGLVSGVVEKEDSYGLILGSDAATVFCAFEDLPDIDEGTPITVKGICSGYLMDVIMNDCIVIKN